jgi:hypothetical protein
MQTRLLDPAEQGREADAVYEYGYEYEHGEACDDRRDS